MQPDVWRLYLPDRAQFGFTILPHLGFPMERIADGYQVRKALTFQCPVSSRPGRQRLRSDLDCQRKLRHRIQP